MIGSLDPDQNDLEQRILEETRAHGPTPEAIDLFRDLILSYFRAHGRDLPWRHTTDPYRILVSEIMLQQTQVERVAVKYPPEFLEQFPDFEGLARARRSEVLRAWQGMGYNRRAIALQETARRVTEEYGGELPRRRRDARDLPGGDREGDRGGDLRICVQHAGRLYRDEHPADLHPLLLPGPGRRPGRRDPPARGEDALPREPAGVV
ncbi:hypothetical protein [Methanoculleus chikugoensis]|uniref:hypothetical protein n=1 Tax=Methanoculleus chikugoensis TaxID=118126 RepID=UPI000B1C0486|nr:hypothetical protein [Methanoculleus chikugoensis]